MFDAYQRYCKQLKQVGAYRTLPDVTLCVKGTFVDFSTNDYLGLSRDPALLQAAMEAGLAVRVEPDTHNLLLGEFSKADCRRIFPKYASKQYQEKFQAVLNALEVVSSPACTISAEEKTAYVQARIDALPVLKKHELKGLRIDAAIENPMTDGTKWIDVSVTHTSAASYIDVELKAVGQKMTASNIAATFELPDYLRTKPSPSLLKREPKKNSNTQGLSPLRRKEKSLQSPTFASFIVSDFGDCLDAIKLQECLVTRARRTESRWMCQC